MLPIGILKVYTCSRVRRPEVLTGTNVGIWYKAGGTYSNTNTNNLPSSKQTAWDDWWKANEAACDKAAADFWNQLNK